MGAVTTRRSRSAVVSRATGRPRRRGDEHPLITLQRTAGNQAVAALVQRRKKEGYHSSKVALAVMEKIYEGKCDAVTKGAAVRYKWSRGLLGKDRSIIFECGPQSFEFSSFRPYFSDRFPWDLELADGGTAFVSQEVSDALDDVKGDFDDAGPKFWSGYHVIIGLLDQDLQAYCQD